MSDAVYKAMLAEPRVARDLIVGFVAPWCGDGWLDGVDLDSLAPAPTEIVADDRRRRLVDVAWSARLRGAGGPDEPSSVHFVVEHQSTVDPGMALRFEEYRGLLRQRIVRRLLGDGRRLRRGEKVDAVLCVLVYDGAAPWDAPADSAELEAGAPRGHAGNRYLAIDLRRDPVEHLPESNAARRLAELARGGPRGWPRLARRLGEWLDREADAGLRRAFGLWLDEVNKRLGADLSFESAEEAGTMIAERLAEFEAEIRAESERKGRAEGRAAGRAEGREAGRAEGREAGFGEGVALEKTHLCRMAGRRFGAAAAESLAVALADVSDPDRLARAGDCIVDSGSAGEFVAGVRATIATPTSPTPPLHRRSGCAVLMLSPSQVAFSPSTAANANSVTPPPPTIGSSRRRRRRSPKRRRPFGRIRRKCRRPCPSSGPSDVRSARVLPARVRVDRKGAGGSP